MSTQPRPKTQQVIARARGKPASVDEYLARVSEDKRAALEKLRGMIRSLVPKAEECLSYGLPAFRLNGRPLIALGAAEHHCALYPMSSTTIKMHQKELKHYETSKGTIRFQPDKPLPAALVEKLVKARLAESQVLNAGARSCSRRTL